MSRTDNERMPLGCPLGYGDIVTSERWCLLGALDAANDVLMFGLLAGAILPVMTLGQPDREPQTKRGPK